MPADHTPAASAELGDYVRVLRRHRGLIVICALLGLFAGAAYSLLAGPSYTSVAKVQLATPSSTLSKDQNTTDVATEASVMHSQPVAQRVQQILHSPLSTDEILAKAVVDPPTDARVIVVRYTATKPGNAQLGAQAFADAYIGLKTDEAKAEVKAKVDALQKTIDQLQQQLQQAQAAYAATTDPVAKAAANATITRLNNTLSQTQAQQSDAASTPISGGAILQPAKAPKKASSLALYAGGGFLLGLMGGVALAFLRDRLNSQVREPSDLEAVLDVPVLGSIPKFPERFRNRSAALVTVHAPESSQADAFRRLRAALLIALADADAQVLAVTSPSAGDGKSTVAANLAVTLAQSGRSVLLVSADVRRPSLEELFGLDPTLGLLDVLAGDVTFEQVLVPVGHFRVITSGRPQPNPSDLLQAPAMAELIARARNQFDVVVLDTPPVLAVSDVLGLLPIVDAVLLVVSVEQTTEADVSLARGDLAQSGARVIGAVVNRSTAPTGRYEAYSTSTGTGR